MGTSWPDDDPSSGTPGVDATRVVGRPTIQLSGASPDELSVTHGMGLETDLSMIAPPHLSFA
jgi:hypothetical protein